MRYSFALIAALVGSALAAPSAKTFKKAKQWTRVNPGGIKDLILTKDNTLNGTVHHKGNKPTVQANAQLPMTFVNNFSGGSINAYVQGLDTSGAVVFLSTDNTWIYPSSGGSATPVEITDNIAIPLGAQGESIDVQMPDYISSARVYFAEGSLTFFMVGTDAGESLVQPSVTNLEDPNAGVNFGFVELTNNDSGIYANISYVDFVGMILGMMLTVGDGTTATTPGLTSDAVTSICNDLSTQTNSDGQPWSSLCIAGEDGSPLRALAPTDYGSTDGSAFADYWTSYVDEVWSKYSSSPLNINTQNDIGTIACQVSGDVLTCPNDSGTYAKPSVSDIWGCNGGPFGKDGSENDVHLAVIPRLCAAFQRGTLLLDGGDTQPGLDSSSYYTTDPCNHYSRIVHNYEVDGTGYAFAYDDVNPTGEDQSGTLSSGDPARLTVYVGAPPS